MSNSNANNPDVIAVYVGTTGAATVPVCQIPKNFILQGASIIDQLGVAADNTNYVTATLKQGAVALAAYDSRAANQGALTANVAGAMVVDAGVVAGLVTNGVAGEVPAGTVTLTVALAGTGVVTKAVVQLYGYWK